MAGGVSRKACSVPAKRVASRLSIVVVLGSAWMSESCSVVSASRKVVRLFPPTAIV